MSIVTCKFSFTFEDKNPLIDIGAKKYEGSVDFECERSMATLFSTASDEDRARHQLLMMIKDVFLNLNDFKE